MAAGFTTALFSQIRLLFPEEGLVYDYKLDDAGLSSTEEDVDEEVIREVKYFIFNSKLGNLGGGTRKQHSPTGFGRIFSSRANKKGLKEANKNV